MSNIGDNVMDRFATDLLHEVKVQAKRWFIAFIVMCAVELLTIFAFMWYLSLPAEDVSIENDTGTATYIGNDFNGEINNGENTSNQTDTNSQIKKY